MATAESPETNPLELRLMLSLPWLGAVLLAVVPALVLLPRPVLTRADRMLIVAAADDAEVIADPAAAEPEVLGAISGLGLFDLAGADDHWVRRWPRGWTARGRLDFRPEEVRRRLGHQTVDTGGSTLDLEVAMPQAEPGGPELLTVTAQANRLLPPATWDLFVYRVGELGPTPLLVLRDQTTQPRLARDSLGRLIVVSRGLERRGRFCGWQGDRLVERASGTPTERLRAVGAGLVATLRWWMLLLVAPPVLGLLRGCGALLREALDLAPYTPARLVVPAVGWSLLLGAGLATGAWLGLRALWWMTTADLLCGLLLPVAMTLVVALPIRLLGWFVGYRWS